MFRRDHFRREILHNDDRAQRSRDASVLIDSAARAALDLGNDVILDGLFNLRDYSDSFERLHAEHRGLTRIYQFDVSLDETIRRHSERPLSSQFGVERNREWCDGWQPLPWYDETRVVAETTTDELVSAILRDLERS